MVKMNVTRRVTLLGEAMAQCGEAYRSDMILYMDCVNGTYGCGQKEIRKWEKNELINSRYINKKEKSGDEAYQALVLTHPGKLFVSDNELSGDHRATMKYIEDNMKDFDTSDTKQVKVALLDVRAKLMFESAGIPAFAINKPTLKKLYEKLSENKIGTSDINISKVREDSMYKQVDKDEAVEMLNSGIYYSIAEVKQFLNCFDYMDYDEATRSRARGMFISNENCFLVYIPRRGENKNIRINGRGEANLQEMLKELLKLTNVNRRVQCLEKKQTLNDNFETEINGISAIVIGDTDDIVYKLGKGLSKADEKGETAENRMWLTNNKLFKRVYAISVGVTGVQSISYLCSNNIETWHEDAKEKMEHALMIKYYDYDPYFPGAETRGGHSVGYMPVYEMNTLYQIKTSKTVYALMVYPDMIKAINKFVCKEMHYYDIDSGDLLNQTETICIQSNNGTPLGREILIDEIKKRRLEYNLKIIEEAYKQFGYKNKEDFYNAIAKREEGVPTVDEIISTLELDKRKNKKRKKQVRVGIMVESEFKEKLKKAAKAYNLSITKYINRLIKSQVETDALKYEELLEEDRKIRKGVRTQ